MRRVFAAGLVYVALAATAIADPIRVPPRRTVAKLGVCSVGASSIVAITDGLSASDCAVGGGITEVICTCRNGAWEVGGVGPAGADGIPRTIQDEGTDLTQRLTVNFAGAGVTATDDAVHSRTNVTVTTPAHALTHQPGGTDPLVVDAAAATGSLRTLGTGMAQAAAGNDSRLTDSRVPTAHAASHKHLGPDEIGTATPGANAIPKAGGAGTLALGWIPISSSAAASSNYLTGYDASTGLFTRARPVCADLSDAAASCAIDSTNASNLSSGTVPLARLSALTLPADTTSTASNFISAYNSVTGTFTKVRPAFSDLSDLLAVGQLPLSFNATTATAWDHTPSPCGSGNQFVTGISAAGVLTCGPAPFAHARIVYVDSAATANDSTIPLYTTLSAAIAYVAGQSPAVIAPWEIAVYPGTAGSGSDNSNYQESGNLVVPLQTVIQGVSRGVIGASSSVNPGATIKLTCTSGICLKLVGGDTLADLNVQYRGAPTAAVQVIGLDNTGSGSTQGVNISNVFLSVAPQNSTFTVDGITNTAAQSYLAYVAIGMSGGSAANRALVNTDTVAGRGSTVSTSRFTGQTACSKLIENAAASGGGINLFATRIDKKCTCDLSSGGAPIAAYNTPYWAVCGTTASITSFGPTYLDGGTSLPAACSPRESWMDLTASAERLCLCNAAGAWLCKAFP